MLMDAAVHHSDREKSPWAVRYQDTPKDTVKRRKGLGESKEKVGAVVECEGEFGDGGGS